MRESKFETVGFAVGTAVAIALNVGVSLSAELPAAVAVPAYLVSGIVLSYAGMAVGRRADRREFERKLYGGGE